MIAYCKPTNISIYVNSARKTAAQIQRELGCDVLINGGLFDGNFKPCCWLKADGKLLHSEAWGDFGYGWDSATLVMDSTMSIAKYRNFISCVALMKDGVNLKLSYPAALGGKRGRSAIGVRPDGIAVVYCVKDGAEAATPENLQSIMRGYGCVSALMLDGGGSSQCIMPDGKISSSRIVQNFIAIWTGKVEEKPVTDCPFAEPTHNVGRWCFFATRNENRWVQWQLNRHGAALDVDGVFGKLSDAALRKFQRANGLTADGICGKQTRGHLLDNL